MFQRVFIVCDRFEIEGKGLVLTGVTHDDSLRIKNGAIVLIKRPMLPDIEAVSLGFEVFRNDWSPQKPRNFGLLIASSVGIGNVPPQSEIWADT